MSLPIESPISSTAPLPTGAGTEVDLDPVDLVPVDLVPDRVLEGATAPRSENPHDPPAEARVAGPETAPGTVGVVDAAEAVEPGLWGGELGWTAWWGVGTAAGVDDRVAVTITATSTN